MCFLLSADVAEILHRVYDHFRIRIQNKFILVCNSWKCVLILSKNNVLEVQLSVEIDACRRLGGQCDLSVAAI